MKICAKLLAAAAACGSLLAPSAAMAEDWWQFSLGADYSTGDYGDEVDTEMLAVPVGAKYQNDNFSVKASVPWVRVTGPEGIVPGDGGVTPGDPNGGSDTVRTDTRSGIGDVNLTAGYSLPVGSATWFDIVGKAKLPTASKAKFLGTGTTDFTLAGELLHSFGQVSVGLTGGRRFNGSNDLFPLNDVWQAGGGVYGRASERLSLGLGYEWREGALDQSPDRSELTGSATYSINRSMLLQGYGYTGFSDGSPDAGAGLQLLFRLGRN